MDGEGVRRTRKVENTVQLHRTCNNTDHWTVTVAGRLVCWPSTFSSYWQSLSLLKFIVLVFRLDHMALYLSVVGEICC
jgi:hypothetical protein